MHHRYDVVEDVAVSDVDLYHANGDVTSRTRSSSMAATFLGPKNGRRRFLPWVAK
jgi:hypothetical protein